MAVNRRSQQSLVFGTEPQIGFVFKYWAALLLFIAAFLIAGWDLFQYPARIPLALVLLTWALLSLTAADVRMTEDALLYRRFRRWKPLRYSEITECRLCWWAVYGSMTLKCPVMPWRKLYFVTARPGSTPPPRALVDAINTRRQISAA